MPSKPRPSGVGDRLAPRRGASCTSQQVSCRVSSGAPRQLELAAGLERDVGSRSLGQRDRRCRSRAPAPSRSASASPSSSARMPRGAVVGQRPQVVAGEAELLVLGADPPVARCGLQPGLEILDQLAAVGDRLALGSRRCRHAELPSGDDGEVPVVPAPGEPYRGEPRACQARRRQVAGIRNDAAPIRQRAGDRSRRPLHGAPASIRQPPEAPSC